MNIREDFLRAGEMYRSVVKYHQENEDRAGTAEFKIQDARNAYKRAGMKVKRSMQKRKGPVN